MSYKDEQTSHIAQEARFDLAVDQGINTHGLETAYNPQEAYIQAVNLIAPHKDDHLAIQGLANSGVCFNTIASIQAATQPFVSSEVIDHPVGELATANQTPAVVPNNEIVLGV